VGAAFAAADDDIVAFAAVADTGHIVHTPLDSGVGSDHPIGWMAAATEAVVLFHDDSLRSDDCDYS